MSQEIEEYKCMGIKTNGRRRNRLYMIEVAPNSFNTGHHSLSIESMRLISDW